MIIINTYEVRHLDPVGLQYMNACHYGEYSVYKTLNGRTCETTNTSENLHNSAGLKQRKVHLRTFLVRRVLPKGLLTPAQCSRAPGSRS